MKLLGSLKNKGIKIIYNQNKQQRINKAKRYEVRCQNYKCGGRE